MSAEHKLKILKERALLFQRCRSFFEERGILEVDVPALNPYAPIDRHIEVMEVENFGFLHTSPEYGIKTLLSFLRKDLFQISHVFRKNEKGRLHNPEFTMVEWYRVSMDYFDYIEEVLDFCSLFVGKKKKHFLTYDNAFKIYANIDSITPINLESSLRKNNISYSKDTDLKDLVHTHLIEPNLGKEGFTILYDYPKEEAALAKTYYNGTKEVAKRFEVYYQGIELANGYDELSDPKILKERLEKESISYQQNFQKNLLVNPALIKAMEDFPDCCGVAVGFDRLLMLRLGLNSIEETLPLCFDDCQSIATL